MTAPHSSLAGNRKIALLVSAILATGLLTGSLWKNVSLHSELNGLRARVKIQEASSESGKAVSNSRGLGDRVGKGRIEGDQRLEAILGERDPIPGKSFHDLQQLATNSFSIAREDFDAIISLLEGRTSQVERNAILRGAFSSIAMGDPSTALRSARRLENSVDRELALHVLVESWTRGEPPDAVTLAQITGRFGPSIALGMALLDSPRVEPELAVTWANEIVDGPRRVELLGRVAGSMAGDDLEKALTLGSGLTGLERLRFFDLMAQRWADRNPSEAWNWTLDLKDSNVRERTQVAILQGWSNSEPDRASANLDVIENPRSRMQVVGAIAQNYALNDTEDGYAWAELIADEREREQAMRIISRTVPVGIGAMVGRSDGYPAIMEVIPGGPAEASGLVRANDRILAVDSGSGEFQDVWQFGTGRLVGLIRGESGTPVRLRLLPEGARETSEAVEVEITRQEMFFATE